MKREVNCLACADAWQKTFGAPTWPGVKTRGKAKGEGMRQVFGSVVRDGLVCDGCNETLAPGAAAVATSLYTKGTPYFEWEAEALDVGEVWKLQWPIDVIELGHPAPADKPQILAYNESRSAEVLIDIDDDLTELFGVRLKVFVIAILTETGKFLIYRETGDQSW